MPAFHSPFIEELVDERDVLRDVLPYPSLRTPDALSTGGQDGLPIAQSPVHRVTVIQPQGTTDLNRNDNSAAL
jgi:hypothetical protein